MDNDDHLFNQAGPIDDLEGPIDVVRKFTTTGMTLGVGNDGNGRFWVYDIARGTHTWHRHCGPYATWQQAHDWIMAIRDSNERV
jgi:hypothetical protein